jgi:hypothetical protein
MYYNLKCIYIQGIWEWTDGSANWLSGEPNDLSGVEDYLEIYLRQEWNDKICTYARPYICKTTTNK